MHMPGNYNFPKQTVPASPQDWYPLPNYDLEAVELSPTVWQGINDAIIEPEKDTDGEPLRDDQGNLVYGFTSLTRDDYIALLEEKGIKKSDGTALSDKEIQATLEELEATEVLAKRDDFDQSGVYDVLYLDPGDTTESSRPKRYHGSYGASFSESRAQRFWAARKDEFNTRRINYTDNTKAFGAATANVARMLTFPNWRARRAERREGAEDRREERIDAGSRMFRLSLAYEPFELQQARENQQIVVPNASVKGDEILRRFDAAVRAKPIAEAIWKARQEGKDEPDPFEMFKGDPEYAKLFTADSLEQLEIDINKEAQPFIDKKLEDINRQREAEGLDPLDRLPFSEMNKILTPINRAKVNDLAGWDIPARVFNAVTAARQVHHILKAWENKARKGQHQSPKSGQTRTTTDNTTQQPASQHSSNPTQASSQQTPIRIAPAVRPPVPPRTDNRSNAQNPKDAEYSRSQESDKNVDLWDEVLTYVAGDHRKGANKGLPTESMSPESISNHLVDRLDLVKTIVYETLDKHGMTMNDFEAAPASEKAKVTQMAEELVKQRKVSVDRIAKMYFDKLLQSGVVQATPVQRKGKVMTNYEVKMTGDEIRGIRQKHRDEVANNGTTS